MERFNVALDGPAGAGKSTVARLVAGELGFVYVDTGAMYRAVTWKAIQSGIAPDQEDQVAEMARLMRLELTPGEDGQQVIVDGVNVTREIRSPEINRSVSLYAQIPEVRRLLADKQKQMAARKGVVMDGRDIGTQVLPDAEVKVFLTASPRVRAERRHKEMDPPSVTVEELEREIAARDELDRTRKTSPLMQAEDAVLLDSSDLNLGEVVQRVLEICRSRVSGGKSL
ncbi:cytidylate kinase [Paenibacillus sp. J31TS4]|uniref:(d)CMP kinase n=1 Tax=Paenibacillus sp. J31TS4 TaxID=2807195 RepID=UPI001B160625|nr:(d)CMP kinase [Paenibacillus sp. J31TS4]GIP37494.1 cytidylate kinase [Paenibacillus sp. J31TS4]